MTRMLVRISAVITDGESFTVKPIFFLIDARFGSDIFEIQNHQTFLVKLLKHDTEEIEITDDDNKTKRLTLMLVN